MFLRVSKHNNGVIKLSKICEYMLNILNVNLRAVFLTRFKTTGVFNMPLRLTSNWRITINFCFNRKDLRFIRIDRFREGQAKCAPKLRIFVSVKRGNAS